MSSFKLYLNTGKGTPQNRPIMVSYHFNNQRLIYYTGLKIAESGFNPIGRNPAKPEIIDRVYINNRLALIRNLIGTIENESLAGGKVLTPDLFRIELNNRLKPKPIEPGKPHRVTLKEYFDMYIAEMPNRANATTGRKLSKALPIKYTTIKNLFVDFCTFEGRDYDFQDIDSQFFDRFTAYLMNVKRYATNTHGRTIKFLKTVLNRAKEQGYNDNSQFSDVLKAKAFEESESIYLNETELEAIRTLNLTDRAGLDRVRDLFLIGCETGLRFSDYTTLKTEDIDLKENKVRVLAKKTGRKVVIPLSPNVLTILQKYQFTLPKAISNQKFNEALKVIAELAGITEPVVVNITRGGELETTIHKKYELVTSHVARRSFATNQIKKGLEPMLVMSITGHKTESEFLKYIKLTSDEKAELFAARNNW